MWQQWKTIMVDRQKIKEIYDIIDEYHKNYGIIKLNSKYSIRRLKNGILVISSRSGFIGLAAIIKYMFDDQKVILKYTEQKNLLRNWYEQYKKDKAIEDYYYE